MSSLRERLIEARTTKRLSQSALAKLVKCGQTTIASIENGRNQSSKLVPRIADVLGVSVKWLDTGKGSKESSQQPTQTIQIVRDTILDDLDVLPKHEQEIWRIQIKAAADVQRAKSRAAKEVSRKQEDRESTHDPTLGKRRASR